jgi:signal transduction histidine kinase
MISKSTEPHHNSPMNTSNTEVIKRFDESLEFISLIIHDLQGPLASMKTLTKFLISGKYNPENDIHAALVRSSKNALERTEAIIHDLLESANRGDLSIHLNPGAFDLREIIADSINAMNGSAFDYGITLNIDLPKKPAMANVDRYYLVRVIDNLLYNALKHSSRGKSILAKIEQDNSQFIISICDEGIGLDGIDLNAIFDKYEQVSLRNTGKYRGIGLGLYFCKMSVSAMGGKIWAESNARAGACFKIALPALGGN